MATQGRTPTGAFYNDGREVALHKTIMELPRDTLQGNAKAVAAALEESTQRMITFKGPKLAAAREALEGMSPPPKVILELGTYVGCSAVSWGAILKDIWKDSPKDFAECRVYACELNEDIAKIASDFVKLAGLENTVQICDGKPAADTMRALKEEGKLTKADMIFFDHWKECYLPDLQLAEELELLSVGSLLIADNTDIPGAPLYLAYLRAGGSGNPGSYKFETKSIDTKAGRGPGSDLARSLETLLTSIRESWKLPRL